MGLQFLTIPAGTQAPRCRDGTKYADYANTHNYTCSCAATTIKLVDNVCWNGHQPDVERRLGRPVRRVRAHVAWGFCGLLERGSHCLRKLPKVSTETGWVTTGQGDAISEEQCKQEAVP